MKVGVETLHEGSFALQGGITSKAEERIEQI